MVDIVTQHADCLTIDLPDKERAIRTGERPRKPGPVNFPIDGRGIQGKAAIHLMVSPFQ